MFCAQYQYLAMICKEQPLAFAEMSVLMSALEYTTVSTSHTDTSQQNPVDYLQRTIQCMKVNQRQSIKLHSEKMQAILSSKSWKITQPLRVLKRTMDNCANAIKNW